MASEIARAQTQDRNGLGGGPPCFPPDYSCPVVLRIPARLHSFRLRGCYPLRLRFPARFSYVCFSFCRSSTPSVRRLSVWALSISLAATLKIDVSFSSSGYLDVSVHRVPSVTLCIHVTVMAHYRHRVSPFGYPWIYRLFAAPHGFSQLTTSFFGSWCQGIRPMLLLA